jgi:hypothetical protein
MNSYSNKVNNPIQNRLIIQKISCSKSMMSKRKMQLRKNKRFI